MERGSCGPALESRSYRIIRDMLGGSMWLKVQVQVIFLTPKFQSTLSLGVSLPPLRTDLSSFFPNIRALEGNSISDFLWTPVEPSLGQMDNGTRKYLLLESREDPRE